MKYRRLYFLMIITMFISIISCAVYKKEHAVSCKNAHINGHFYTVECMGELDASQEAIKASFSEYALKVCEENGYSGFRVSGAPPEMSSFYNATIECTK